MIICDDDDGVDDDGVDDGVDDDGVDDDEWMSIQVEQLVNMVAEHLGLQPSVFSLARYTPSNQVYSL